jgi:hypothetical protein
VERFSLVAAVDWRVKRKKGAQIHRMKAVGAMFLMLKGSYTMADGATLEVAVWVLLILGRRGLVQLVFIPSSIFKYLQ